MKETTHLLTPTIYIQGEVDGVNPPSQSEDIAKKFAGPFERSVLASIGHFPTREAPNEVARLLVDHFPPRLTGFSDAIAPNAR